MQVYKETKDSVCMVPDINDYYIYCNGIHCYECLYSVKNKNEYKEYLRTQKLERILY